MRVLMLTAHPGITGPLPKLAPLVIDEMRRSGCDVNTEPWSHRGERESIAVKVVSRAGDLWRVRRRLGRQRFDAMLVTTTHDWPALLRDMPLLALTRGRCRVRVLHFHGSMADRLGRPGNRLLKLCSRWLVTQCDAVFVLSEEERAQWSAFCPEARFDVVVNPFVPSDAACQAPPHEPGRPPVLLFIGRLIPEKGIFDLLTAVKALSRHHDCILRVAGQGPSERALRDRVAELGLGGRVDLMGYVEGEELEGTYASADVFVLPTYFGEGFPTVITEAMSFGLPVVTTPIRGTADLLSEGENALFVPPRRPAELVRALLRLLNDPGLRADMGERNRMKVREFAPSAVVPRYVDIIRSLATGELGDSGDTL